MAPVARRTTIIAALIRFMEGPSPVRASDSRAYLIGSVESTIVPFPHLGRKHASARPHRRPGPRPGLAHDRPGGARLLPRGADLPRERTGLPVGPAVGVDL